jgi:DNA polymerase-3 subunit alpha
MTKNSFYNNFSSYEGCSPPGVRLPKIVIEQRHYKRLGISNEVSNLDFLKALCVSGENKYEINEKHNKQEYTDRLDMELSILSDLGFIDYILLNWDVLNFCREEGIPAGPGRGSAAGSLVLFLIGVTQVDPIKYELFFERFVSKSRAKTVEKDGISYLDGSLLADVDNDIAYEHRYKVIEYIESKYPGRTSKILTLTTLSGKLCAKECGKLVGGMSEQEVNEISDSIPKKFGLVVPLPEAYEESEKFRSWADSNEKVYKIALKLQGLNKNVGVHPSGIAISFEKLSDICPVQKTSEGALVTGYDMNWVAELMVKFDILGLRTLSVIYNTCKYVGMDIYDVDLSKDSLYKPLQNLKSRHGIFQIEADTDFRVCKKIKPRNLDQLSAVVAIARPGAIEFMDYYERYVSSGAFQSVHSFFDDVLSYTGGIPLYQEQLMKMAVKVGFTLDEAEQLRRIVGKKKVAQMPEWKEKIENKIKDLGLDENIGSILWKVAEDSANYSFNKSHSICYSILAAWTTYLKFNHPKEFFLSLLEMTQFEPSPQEEINKISQELSFFDITLLPPDLIQSEMGFSLDNKNIRFGLNSVKGISEKSLNALRSFRNSENTNKYEIFISAKQAGLNIGILSSLIQAGALSDFKSKRSRLVLEAQSFNILTDREKRNFIELGERFEYDCLNTINGCIKESLIADDGRVIFSEGRLETFKKKYYPYKEIYDRNKSYEKFANWYFERKLLGFSHSTELKDSFGENESLNNSIHFFGLELKERGKFIGVIEDCIKRKSKKDIPYIKMTISDEYGTYDAMMMDNREKALSKYTNNGGKIPKKDNIVIITGQKGDDILFLDKLSIVDEKIYMKLSDIK